VPAAQGSDVCWHCPPTLSHLGVASRQQRMEAPPGQSPLRYALAQCTVELWHTPLSRSAATEGVDQSGRGSQGQGDGPDSRAAQSATHGHELPSASLGSVLLVFEAACGTTATPSSTAAARRTAAMATVSSTRQRGEAAAQRGESRRPVPIHFNRFRSSRP
jgi:hypothetical protein